MKKRQSAGRKCSVRSLIAAAAVLPAVCFSSIPVTASESAEAESVSWYIPAVVISYDSDVEYLEYGVGIVFSEDSTVYVLTVGDEISSEAYYYMAFTSDENTYLLEEAGESSDLGLVLYEAEDTTDDPTAFPVSDSLPDAGETVTIYYTTYDFFTETLTMSAAVAESEYTDSTSYVFSLDSFPDDDFPYYPMAITDSEGNLVGIITSYEEAVPAAAITDSLTSSGSSSSSSDASGPLAWIIPSLITAVMLLGLCFMIKQKIQQRRQKKNENLSKSASDIVESDTAEPGIAESDTAESDTAEPDIAESDIAESDENAENAAGEEEKGKLPKGVRILLYILILIALAIARYILNYIL